jgi:hypothetical protein
LRLFSFERKQGAKVRLRIADLLVRVRRMESEDAKPRLKSSSIGNPQSAIRNGAAPGIVIALETSHCIHIARGLISATEAL